MGKRTRKMRGGGWNLGNLGSGWNQFMNSLTLQNVTPANSAPSGPAPLKGGRHRKRRGGNLGLVLSQAAVPGALIALNQTAKRRRRK